MTKHTHTIPRLGHGYKFSVGILIEIYETSLEPSIEHSYFIEYNGIRKELEEKNGISPTVLSGEYLMENYFPEIVNK